MTTIHNLTSAMTAKPPRSLFAATFAITMLITGHCLSNEETPSLAPPIVSPFNSTKGEAVYHPVVIIGKPKAKERIWVVWNASQASADMVNNYIVPLLSRTRAEKTSRAVFFIQDIASKQGVRGPAMPLLCAGNPSQYTEAVFAYLADKQNKDILYQAEGILGLLINKSTEFAINRIHVNLKKCLADRNIFKRAAVAISELKSLRERGAIVEAPSIIWKGRRLTNEDAASLRDIARQWR